MSSKSLLDSFFQVFGKWNFFKPKEPKVHPSLEEGFRMPEDNSSSDTCDSDNDQAVKLWHDFIEEYDLILVDGKGQKAEMYLLDNQPLINGVVTGAGLHSITEEIIQTFGYQVLNIVLDVICDPTVNREKDTLDDILNRMKLIDYSKGEGQKLFVWIEDFPSPESGDSDLLGRLIITELMRRKIEPQMVIPYHDMDIEVLNTVKSAMHRHLKTTVPFGEDASIIIDHTYEESIYLIALRIALASANCNIVLIDVNQQFIDAPVFRDFTEFARTLGHEVMFVRNTPNTNKHWIVNDFANRVEEWARSKSMNVGVNYDEEEQLVVQRSSKKGEILHKLTQSHFIRDNEEDDDSAEGDGSSESELDSQQEGDATEEDDSGSDYSEPVDGDDDRDGSGESFGTERGTRDDHDIHD